MKPPSRRYCLKKSSLLFVLLILAYPILGHAAKYELIEAEKVSTSMDDKNEDIVVDAAKVQHLFLFGEDTQKKMMAIASKGGRNAYSDTLRLFCDGKKSRINPEVKIVAVLPIAPPGLPINKVAAGRKRFIELSKRYLQEKFFFDLADTRMSGAGEVTNPDFDTYRRYVIETNGEKKYGNRFSVEVPFVPTRKENELVNFYRQVKFLPSLSSMRWDEADQSIEHASTNFLFLFSNEGNLVMLPKIAASYKRAWGDGVTDKGQLSSVSSDTLETKDALQTFYRHSFYFPSEVGWRVKEVSDGPIYPLQLALAEDLAFLKKNYAFVFPVETANKIFGDILEKGIEQYVGYEQKSGKLTFSSALALEHQDFQWEGVLASQTSITQSDQDGKIVFRLKLDMGLACERIVSKVDLQGQ